MTFPDGRTFDLSKIPGNGWNQSRLNKAIVAVQEFMDTIVALDSLSGDDSDKTITKEELLTKFGGRMFLDGKGNIVSRSEKFDLTFVGGNLRTHIAKVR